MCDVQELTFAQLLFAAPLEGGDDVDVEVELGLLPRGEGFQIQVEPLVDGVAPQARCREAGWQLKLQI